MATQKMTPEAAVERGRELYERQIRAQVEPGHDGQFIVINLETGQYEVGIDDLIVSDRARERFGDAPTYVGRVGRRTAYRLGLNRVRAGC